MAKDKQQYNEKVIQELQAELRMSKDAKNIAIGKSNENYAYYTAKISALEEDLSAKSKECIDQRIRYNDLVRDIYTLRQQNNQFINALNILKV
jgi:hypothetical protein